MEKFFSTRKLHLLVFVWSFLILTRFKIDPDLGWHLAIGNRFLEFGEIIRGDQFSWTMPGYIFGNYFFAYQIFVAYLFKSLGHILTAILFGAIGGFGVLVLLPRKLNVWGFLGVFLGLCIATFNLGVRPSMISFLFFSLTLVFLTKRAFEKPYWAIWWFIIFALWINFHQGFLVGLLVFIGYLIIDFFWRKSKRGNLYFYSRCICILAALAGILTSPFHAYLFKSITLDLSGLHTWSEIVEWKPLPLFFPENIFYAASGAIFIYIFVKKFKKIDPVLFLIASFLFMLPFLAANLALFWVVIFIFISSRYLDFEFKFKVRLDYLSSFFLKVIVLLVFTVFILNFAANLMESVDLRKRLILDGYPVEAADFLRDEGLTRGLFNEYGWGGYLDWQYPNIKVFIDGRMTGWRMGDDYILADFTAINNGKCAVLTKYQIQSLLLSSLRETKCFGDWKVVYADSVAKVLVKPL